MNRGDPPKKKFAGKPKPAAADATAVQTRKDRDDRDDRIVKDAEERMEKNGWLIPGGRFLDAAKRKEERNVTEWDQGTDELLNGEDAPLEERKKYPARLAALRAKDPGGDVDLSGDTAVFRPKPSSLKKFIGKLKGFGAKK